MRKSPKFSPEVVERAVRMVYEAKQALFPIDVHYNGGARIPIEGMKKLLSDHAQADLELTFTPEDPPRQGFGW